MTSLEYRRGGDLASALNRAQTYGDALWGDEATMSALMRVDVLRPSAVVAVNGTVADYGRIERDGESLRIGSLVRVCQLADDPVIAAALPALSQAVQPLPGALWRNSGSAGGRVLQPRSCSFLRDPAVRRCNKRWPGSGCAAQDAADRTHAVLGVSDHCAAAYAEDMAVALLALDATVEISGDAGTRSIPIEALHVLPVAMPAVETSLEPGELIAGFVVPVPMAARRSVHVKVRDWRTRDHAVISVAAMLELEGRIIRQARIALGGAATKPWRARAAEAMLAGERASAAIFRAAAKAAFVDAAPRKGNAFKVALGQRTITRALRQAAALSLAPTG
jgi:xanthine dehydrogenase YagS FAD-binding subunit